MKSQCFWFIKSYYLLFYTFTYKINYTYLKKKTVKSDDIFGLQITDFISRLSVNPVICITLFKDYTKII